MGHVSRKGKIKDTCKILVGKPVGNRKLGRYKRR